MPFAHPTWLVSLLLVPFLGAGAFLISNLRSRKWQAFMSSRLRPALLKKTPVFTRWLSFLFLLVALALLLVTLARPNGEAGVKQEKIKGRNVLFALDLSRSMRCTDVKPDRLAQAKAVIYEMMDVMPNDRVGVVGFEGTSFLFAPLTIDHAAVKETVGELDETWIPTGGSDIVGALKLSIETLKKTGLHNNALILLSDGEKHSGKLDDVLAEAKSAGVYIFTVGVGTEKGDYVPDSAMRNGRFSDRQSQSVVTQMHPEVLRQIANETKGRFVIAGAGIDIPELARTASAELDQFELEGRDRRVVVEFYQWLLAPALAALLVSIVVATRWRPLAIRTAVTATLASTVSVSGAATQQDAAADLQNGKTEEARVEFHNLADAAKRKEDAARLRLGEADAAYKAGEFRKADDAYSRALMSDDAAVSRAAHMGAGTSLFHLGWQTLSGSDAYPEKAPDDFKPFDEMVSKKVMEWLQSDVPDDGETDSYKSFESVVLNWTDAIRHYDSVLRVTPGDKDAAQNRAMTVLYLNHLEEILKIEENQAGGSLGDQGEAQGDAEGDGDGPSGPNGKGKGRGKEPKDQGDGDEKKDKGKGGEGEKDKDKGKDKGPKPGESPTEHAQRMLEQSQDLQKGPNLGDKMGSTKHFNPADPEKDW